MKQSKYSKTDKRHLILNVDLIFEKKKIVKQSTSKVKKLKNELKKIIIKGEASVTD